MKSPPDYSDVVPLQWAAVIEAFENLVPNDRYSSWRNLLTQNNPYGIGHEAWWAALKICRCGQIRSIRMQDEVGAVLRFATPAAVAEMLHPLDRLRPEAEMGLESGDRFSARARVMESVASGRLAGSATSAEAGKEMLRTGRQPRDGDEQLVYNTHQALEYIHGQAAKPLAPVQLAEVHRLMCSGLAGSDEDGDLFRPDAEGPEGSMEKIALPGEENGPRSRLEAICAFANGQTPDFFVHPVIRGIILHFWLAREQPFRAANGRIARALFYWTMRRHGYGLFEYLALSPVLLAERSQYRRSFLDSAADDNDLTYFILAQLEAIAAAMEVWRNDLVRKKDELQVAGRRLQGFGNLNPRQQSLLAHAYRRPEAAYVIAGHQRSHGVTHQTARDDLFDLVGRELLTVTREGRVYVFRPAVELAGRVQSAGGRRRSGPKAHVAAENLPTTLL